jgi:hypothetical protein
MKPIKNSKASQITSGWLILFLRQAQFGGEGGIRTLGTLLAYGSLANYWFRPLTHLSMGTIIKATKVKKLLSNHCLIYKLF